MNILGKFAIHDKDTQYDKQEGYSKHYLFEIYGKTKSGILFERDLENPDRALLHVGSGIKKAIDYLDERDYYFFRQNRPGNNFFASYTDYKDFPFKKKDFISKEYLVDIVKRYIYMQSPMVWSSTCMGGGKKGVLGNPNWMHGTFILEDKKEYTVIKKFDTVKIFKGEESMYAFSEKEEFCSFKLDEDLYEKAMMLNDLRSFIALNSFGNIEIEKMEKFSSLYKELDEKTKISF